MANVNMGALLLTGFVVVGGAMIGGISRLLSGGSFIEIAGNLPWFRSGTKKQKCKKNVFINFNVAYLINIFVLNGKVVRVVLRAFTGAFFS